MSHFSDDAHLTIHFDDGTGILGPIRNSTNCVHIGTTAVTTIIEMTQLIAKKYRPFESSRFDKWVEKDFGKYLIILERMESESLRRQTG